MKYMPNASDEFSDVSFAITADTGQLGFRAAVLLRSIRDHYPDSSVYTFIPESSYSELSDRLQDIFESESTVVIDKMPVPEYPPTALIRALTEAASEAESKYIAALDTDTILLSKLTKPDNIDNSELFAKPVDIGQQYWGSTHSESDWRRAYSHFGIPTPEMPSGIYSDIDNTELIAPYYHAAVVITSDKDFPSRWLSMTRESAEGNIYKHDEDWFHDQITLSVLSQQYEVGHLTRQQDFPLFAKWKCPDEAQLVHYHNGGMLHHHKNCPILSEIAAYPEFEQILQQPTLTTYYRFFHNYITKFIPYPYNKRINMPIRTYRRLRK